MKKKIVLGLVVSLMLFFACSIYVAYLIEKIEAHHKDIALLNDVEELRRNLNGRIRRAQTDLRLINTRFERTPEQMATDLSELEYFASTCISCHHQRVLQERLVSMQTHVGHYIDRFKEVVLLKSHSKAFEGKRSGLFQFGNSILEEISGLSHEGTLSLKKKTSQTITTIGNYKRVVYGLLIVSPFFVVAIALLFIRSISSPLENIVKAVNELKKGNLGYRIEGKLPNEFGDIAMAINEMSQEMKRYVTQIEEANRRYRLLFESAADAIFIISAEPEDIGKIVDANEAAARMHGYTVEEFCSMRIQDIDVPEDAAKASERIRQILQGQALHFEVSHFKKDGSVFPVEVTATLLEFGGKRYVLAIDRDITLRKETQERLLRAEQLASTGRIASGIAHEIKNPVAGIKAAVEVIKAGEGISEEHKMTLSAVLEEIRRIEGLMKNLLDYARPKKSHPIAIDINIVLDSTVSFLMGQRGFQEGNILIEKDFDPALPQVLVDPQQFRQVFVNLILNARDAMPSGGTLNLKTYLPSPEGPLIVEISDTGTGIPKELKGQIFMPFVTSKKGGTGLGLAICKQIVEAHKGEITVKDNPRGGTIFAIKIPLNLNSKGFNSANKG